MADPEILVLGGPERDLYLAPADLERLDSFANWTWLPCEAGQIQPGHQTELSRRLASVQALVVYSGAPHIGPELMEQAPELRFIGETPHIAGVTRAAYWRFFELMVDELDRFFHGFEPYFELTQRTLDDRSGRRPATH